MIPVRCNTDKVSPYLSKHLNVLKKHGRVLDVGCGNGRNSQFMLRRGHEVDAFDAHPDYGKRLNLLDPPELVGEYDIVLFQYVWMFMTRLERFLLPEWWKGHIAKDATMVIELYEAKIKPVEPEQHKSIEDVAKWFEKFSEFKSVIHMQKEHCILKA